MPVKQTKSRSMLLTLIAVIVFFSGFIGVYLVNAAWERSVPETIIISDSTMTPLEKNWVGIASMQNLSTSSFFYSHYTNAYNQTKLTPLYSGNNTWTISVPEMKPFPAGEMDAVAGLAGFYFVILLPDTESYLINSIYSTVNFTASTQIRGKRVFLSGYDNVALPDLSVDTRMPDIEIYADEPIAHTTLDDYVYDIDVPLHSAINYNQQIGEFDVGYIVFQMYQDNQVGIDAQAIEFTLIVNGTYQDATNKVSAIGYSLGGAAFLCSLTALFMTDSVDLKDILKKVRG